MPFCPSWERWDTTAQEKTENALRSAIDSGVKSELLRTSDNSFWGRG